MTLGRAMGVAWWEMIGYTLFWLKKIIERRVGALVAIELPSVHVLDDTQCRMCITL